MRDEEITNLDIRKYAITDYEEVVGLYKLAGVFDPETDSDIRLSEKSARDPESILVAEDGIALRGSISIIEDGRIAILFRVVTDTGDDRQLVKSQLILQASQILIDRGYQETHIIAPEEDLTMQASYEQYGFTKGKSYRWFWKKLRQ